MPRGTPLSVVASVVALRSFRGLTKLSTTTLTDGSAGAISSRSISQWFLESNSVTDRTFPHVQ